MSVAPSVSEHKKNSKAASVHVASPPQQHDQIITANEIPYQNRRLVQDTYQIRTPGLDANRGILINVQNENKMKGYDNPHYSSSKRRGVHEALALSFEQQTQILSKGWQQKDYRPYTPINTRLENREQINGLMLKSGPKKKSIAVLV